MEPVFNYGMLPLTWENNKEQEKQTGCYGDNDPLDIVELSGQRFSKQFGKITF